MDKYIFYSKGTNHDNADDVAITEANSLEVYWWDVWAGVDENRVGLMCWSSISRSFWKKKINGWRNE